MWIKHSVTLALVALFAFGAGCDKKSNVCPNGATAELSGNHGHTVTIPAEAVQRGLGGTYPVKGTATHQHVVMLKDADMKKLAAGEAVKTRTSSVNAHVHEVELKCK